MAIPIVPDGYQTVTPYVTVEDANALIAFARDAFGARELFRMDRPDGTLAHGEVRIGDTRLMLSQATAEWPAQPGGFHVYVEDVDRTYRRALELGADSVMEPADQFYGDRQSGVRDSNGNLWWIATHLEDVPTDELERRAEEYMAQQPPAAPAG